MRKVKFVNIAVIGLLICFPLSCTANPYNLSKSDAAILLNLEQSGITGGNYFKKGEINFWLLKIGDHKILSPHDTAKNLVPSDSIELIVRAQFLTDKTKRGSNYASNFKLLLDLKAQQTYEFKGEFVFENGKFIKDLGRVEIVNSDTREIVYSKTIQLQEQGWTTVIII